jgi:hypothetical protein
MGPQSIAEIALIQVTLSFYFFLTYTMGFVPVQFRKTDSAVSEAT